jgi:hypothetical protein
MKLELEKIVINNHKQKYPNSCVPMSIELALKLMGRVDVEYYELQDEKKDISRTFSEFDEIIVNNTLMLIEFTISRGLYFPLEDLFKRIQEELDQKKFVICAWKNDSMNYYHAYVIYGNEKEEFLAITTDFGNREFEYIKDMSTRLKDIKGSDILTFKLLN